MELDLKEIAGQVQDSLNDLFAKDMTRPGDLFVVGCSTSEVAGFCIGTQSSAEIAAAILDVVLPEIQSRGLHLAVQCCEHLNRALVVERAAMERYDLTQVWVKPWLHAGGAFAVEAFARLKDPVMVEDIKGRATSGIDIGGTFIGMHLRPVAVPVHTTHRRVGSAVITMARCRPKYIGGPRAQYDQGDGH